MALDHELESGGALKDNLFIDINPENRWGTIRYGGDIINAKVNLHLISEYLHFYIRDGEMRFRSAS